MISVKAGQNLPLSYVFPKGDAGKVVKATIEDLMGALLATVTLTETSAGDQMNNSYPMPAGYNFLKVKFTPYLSGGVTIDTTNDITQEIFAVIVPVLASSLQVLVGCEDQPMQRPVVTSRNSTASILLLFEDDRGRPLDTSNASAVALRIKKELAYKQTDTLQVGTLASGHTYSFKINYVTVSYLSTGGDTQQSILAALLAAIPLAFPAPAAPPVTGAVVGTGPSAVLTLTAVNPGQDLVYSAIDSDLSYANLITNTLQKDLTNGVSPVSGQEGQYLAQLTAQDLSLLPTGDVDVAAVLTLGGQTTVTNVYGALVVQPDILSD